MTTLHIDFETRSTLDLKVVGVYNYVRHPSTSVWCMAYAFGEDEPKLIRGVITPDDLPPEVTEDMNVIYGHVVSGGVVIAHNAPFELAVWNNIMSARFGWPILTPEQTYCTMAQAYAMGLPGGLEDAALAVGLRVRKDLEGRSLMLRMARPRRYDKKGNPVWWDEPEKLERLYEYCKQDVRVERELSKRLVPLPPNERKVWVMDYKINQRGVYVDIQTARAGSEMADKIKERAGEKLAVITNGAVTSPTALSAIKDWCASRKFPVESLDKEHIETYLSLSDGRIPEDVRQVLTLRQEAGKASVAKLNRIQELAGEDERLHDWSQYHGAGTGRFAARGVQMHNLVRDMPPSEVVEDILAHVRDGALDWIDMAYGPPMHMISRCMRSMFWAPKGRVLIGADFTAVEGRGTAWISGEEWKIQAFRRADRKMGPGIYELTASKTFGIPVEQITKDSRERQVGKVEELAFGYQGGIGAARKFLPRSMKNTTDKELNQWKLAWRADHPMTVATWKELEQAAMSAVANPGEQFNAGFKGRQVKFKKAGSFLWCQLPSGRVMCYPYPKLMADTTYGDKLTYMTVPSANDHGKIIADVKNANNWARIGTYGGSLMENVVQALCRDLLVDRMLLLHDVGALIVLHVHDEIVIENDSENAEKVRAYMQSVMRTPPKWAKDFPLWATCEIMRRYGK